MRNLKKFLAAAIAGVMLTAAMCLGASAAKFTDVNANDKVLAEAVDLLTYLNVTKGTTETTFGTNENVTRQQMAAFIYRLMKKGASMEGGENSTTFTDLKDSTYYAYISWANAMGIIKGRSNTVFDPTGTITLQEAYTMVIRALGHDDTDFLFPVDYNDLAETEELALDKGIPSGFSYETPLTRGAVAIILRNAFFAETGHTEYKLEERTLGSEEDNTIKAVLVETEYNPTLAEYVYDVIQGDFRVVATPRNSFNEKQGVYEYEPLYDEFDNADMLQFVAIDDDEEVSDFYYDFAKLGLSGKADDYIMGEFEIFYTLDEDEDIDKIYYAGNSMKHESTTDVKFTTMTPDKTNKWHYYEAYFGIANEKDYVLHKPYISVAGNNIYLFDAPYSYVQPNFGTAIDEDAQYLLKNEKNAKLIGIELLDSEEGTYAYYIKDSFGKGDYKKFIETFTHAAYGGITKCDIYDVDGDGYYDYIRYRPYMFGKMDGDISYTFADVTEHENNKAVYETNKDPSEMKPPQVPTIYYNEANLTGEKFNDGDFVIAHLDTEANEIDVFKVVEKVQGYVSGVNSSNYRITINGKNYSGVDVDKLFYSYNVGGKDRDSDGTHCFKGNAQSLFHKDQNLYKAKALDKEFIVYTYNGKILFYELLEEPGAVYNKDSLIIPLEAGMHDENDAGFFEGEFNTAIGDEIYLIKAWVNDEVKFVPVSIEDMYPKPTRWGDTRDFNDAGVLGKICNYTIDENGIYHITSLLYAEDEDEKPIGINQDASVLTEEDSTEYYAKDLGTEDVMIKKVIANRFTLTDTTPEENTLLGSEEGPRVDSMLLTDSTYIIIRSEKVGSSDDDKFTDRYEYLEFDADSFVNSVAVATDENGLTRYLTNVQYILRADPDSDDRAYLEFLYAETYDFDFTTKKADYNERILLDTYADADENGYYRNFYDILNPYTGEIEEGVAGSKRVADSNSLKDQFDTISGKIVKIDAEGKIDETYKTGDEIKLDDNHHFAFITDYSEKDKVLEIVPVNSADGEANGYYDAGAYYEVDDDTTVMLVKYAKNSDSLYDAEISALTLSDLGSTKNNLKCYNSKMVKPGKDTYNTEYAEYVKCYVMYEDAKKADDHPKAKFVFVIVHDNEDKEFLDLPDSYND